MDDLLNIAPCGFFRFTDDGTILLANLTLAELLNYEPGEIEGKRVEALLSIAGRIFYQTHFFPLLKLHNEANEIYLSLRSRLGADMPVLVNAIRREFNGQAVNDCVAIPIRQRSEYEDEILRAKKAAEAAVQAKEEFLAVVSHELRTPLSSILGWARIARSGDLDQETLNYALEAIERGAKTQAQLIEDLLDFSRITSGKLRLEVRQFELSDVVEAALDVVRPAADAKGIRLQPVLDAKAGLVSGDPDRLQQVVWNLLSNAIKFTPQGGRVQIRLERINSHVELTVSDTGKGISADFLPYVFERFRQADGTTSRRHGGLGLGLSITHQIVELHGGSIRVQSAGEGQGATFIVELPLIIMHGTEQVPDTATGNSTPENQDDLHITDLPRLNGLHILIVDDAPDARDLLLSVLTRSGAQVTAVATAAEAVEKVQQLRPDLLVSDIELPGEDGYSLIRSVRNLDRTQGGLTPAIALTAHARYEDRLRALSAGYQMHVPKPVQPAELICLIANHCSQSLQ